LKVLKLTQVYLNIFFEDISAVYRMTKYCLLQIAVQVWKCKGVHVEDRMCTHLDGMAVELKVNNCIVKLTFDVGK
jgi:hypothetical protein